PLENLWLRRRLDPTGAAPEPRRTALGYSRSLVCVAGFLCAAHSALAAESETREPWTITLGFENDTVLSHSDRHYSSGLFASAVSGASDDCEFCADVSNAVMLPGGDTPVYRYGFTFGQSMFTPKNLHLVNPSPTDRPYAGWLFAGARVYRQSDDVLDKV